MPLQVAQGEGLSIKCIRFFLCLMNFLLILFGVCLIGVGGAIQKNFKEVDESLEDQTKAIKGAALISVVVGAIMIFISLFGCFAIYKKNYQMVTAFAVLLGIMFILEVSACATAFALKEKIKAYLHHEVVKVVQKYDMEKKGHVFNDIQQNFQCCAWNSTEDYRFSPYQEQAQQMIKELNIPEDEIRDPAVPDSCCLDEVEYCGLSLVHPVYDVGCVDVISAKIRKAVQIVALIGVGVMLIQLLTIIFACYTRRTLKIRGKVGSK